LLPPNQALKLGLTGRMKGLVSRDEAIAEVDRLKKELDEHAKKN
jgi:hypothetical protein